MSEVRFGLLGPFQVLVDDEPVEIASAAERALLAVLLLAGGTSLSPAGLVDRLWAEDTLPVDPTNALQLRVSKLRRTLAAHGLPTVRRDGGGYRLEVPPGSLDADLFGTRLREARAVPASDATARLRAYDDALALWRGDALADFAGESWAVPESVRLEEMRNAAVAERAQAALALDRYADVIADLEPRVSADPTQEAMAGLLMMALYRAGRQAEALEVYTRTRTVLDEELGLEPSTSLRSLHERVLRQDASLGGSAEISVPLVAPAERAAEGSTHATGAGGNLPTLLAPPIGRDAELASLLELVPGSRLVTLVGPGGAGKTTLGLAAAGRLAGSFRDGAFLVRLAVVRDPASITTAVADALGVPLDGAAGSEDVRARLLSYLQRRHLLLVVDNCEHVVDAAATLVEEVLVGCPEVTVVATSREALAVPGEVQVLVGPLEAPPEGTPSERVPDFAAAQLFLRRATAVRPGAPDDATLAAVARVCRALDGMPLALELAAARVAAMSVPEIADRLDQRFALLTTGARTAEHRQRTLRATVDWSYELLTDSERHVFDRLSVFRGGWTLESAQAVVGGAGADDDVLPALARLVEQSLVLAEPGASTRYRLLETLREYAAERLVDDEERGALERRHATYFRDLAVTAAAGLRGPGQREALRRLREEHANVRAALDWFAGPGDDLDDALRLAGALGLFWHFGRHLEGREVLPRLLGRDGGAPAARALALQALSLVERPRACVVHPSPDCGDAARESLAIFDREGLASEAALSRVLLAVEGVARPDESTERLLAEAEERFRQDDDTWGPAVIGFVRMETALKQGAEDDAVRTGHRAAEAFRRIDDLWGLSGVLYHLGWGLRQFGRYDEAARVLEEAIDVAAGAGLDNTVQWALADLGITRLDLGDREGAADCFARAREVSERVGDGAGAVLAGYSQALLDQGDQQWERALEGFDAAREGFERLGTSAMRGQALLGRAQCLEALGRPETAEQSYTEAAEAGECIGEAAVTSAAWEGLARLADGRGEPEVARDLRERAAALRSSAHRPAPPHERTAGDSPRTATGQ